MVNQTQQQQQQQRQKVREAEHRVRRVRCGKSACEWKVASKIIKKKLPDFKLPHSKRTFIREISGGKGLLNPTGRDRGCVLRSGTISCGLFFLLLPLRNSILLCPGRQELAGWQMDLRRSRRKPAEHRRPIATQSKRT